MNKKLCISVIAAFGIILIGSNMMTAFGAKPENHCVINQAIGLGVLHCLIQPTVGQHFQFMSIGFVCHADVIRVDSETMDITISGGEDHRDIPTCPAVFHGLTFTNLPYTILRQN